MTAQSRLPDQLEREKSAASRVTLIGMLLDALLGESHYYADMCLAYSAEETPSPVFVSTVKIREAGYTKAWNTEESFCYWLQDLIDRKILPPAS